MGLGSAENARFFSQTLEYPLEGLYADPTGACYKALGFYAPQADINPYVKLLAMLTGIGSPGTVQEVGWMGLWGVLSDTHERPLGGPCNACQKAEAQPASKESTKEERC